MIYTTCHSRNLHFISSQCKDISVFSVCQEFKKYQLCSLSTVVVTGVSPTGSLLLPGIGVYFSPKVQPPNVIEASQNADLLHFERQKLALYLSESISVCMTGLLS
jgi:hypothetical protein